MEEFKLVISFIQAISPIFLAYIGYKVAQIKKDTHEVKVLVNSQTGVTTKALAIATQRIADITGAQGDIDSAKTAKDVADKHDINQAIFDSTKGMK